MLQYRREIDGLRAVAVVPVILFHAGIKVFSGGFVGVDVFFVISGYLITSILMAELERGDFSIVRFYERRARRILPALFVVMACCIPFAWAWMLPRQMDDFAQSLIAVTLFASNVLFWRQEGYFAPAAELKPLLHTWSLAVEEQYYLLFPLLLWLLWRFGRNRAFWVIAATALLSLAASELGWRTAPSANFYLAPPRAWELLAGSLCAFLAFGKPQRASNLLSAAGLAAILFAIFRFDETTPFPSLYALVPVVGTALIILYAAPGTWAAKLLGTRAFVGIGLISYSAYLWHQPLFAFARIRSIGDPSQGLLLGLAALSVLLAYLSWRYVERSFRKGAQSVLPTRRGVFVASAIGGAVFIAAGLYGHMTRGAETRLPPPVLAVLASTDPIELETRYERIGDTIGAPGRVPSIALIGDSHAGKYAQWLDGTAARQGVSVRLIAKGWCPPLLGLITDDPTKNAHICADEFQRALRQTIADPAIKTVVLAGEWAGYTSGGRHGSTVSTFRVVGLDHPVAPGNAEAFRAALNETLRVLKAANKRVIVVGPLPEYDFPMTDTVARAGWYGESAAQLRLPVSEYVARNRDVSAAFASVRGQSLLVDPAPVLCDVAWCYPYDSQSQPLYSDGNHLSRRGLDKVGPLIWKAIVSP